MAATALVQRLPTVRATAAFLRTRPRSQEMLRIDGGGLEQRGAAVASKTLDPR